jgi:hypothetical protein
MTEYSTYFNTNIIMITFPATFGHIFEILVPLHIGAAGYHLIKHSVNPLPRMATPEMMSLGSQFVAAALARPGPVAGGVALCGIGGLWLGR